MTAFSIPWRPRVVLTNRVFRLPVSVDWNTALTLDAPGFTVIDSRWEPRSSALYYYLRSPNVAGIYTLTARQATQSVSTVIEVRSLNDLRAFHTHNGAVWPRRWPLTGDWESTKKRQTLQDWTRDDTLDDTALAWWAGQTDDTLSRQFPHPEFPQAHFVNVTQGCPNCGTAVFRHGGFYPWKRVHLPLDFRSTCPSCGSIYPSNNFLANDFTSGPTPDDGFGYFDTDGHVYLFTATYHRDQLMRVDAGMRALTGALRIGPFDPSLARKLAILLVRYAVDTLYVAAVPQFRYGPSLGVEEPWNWGQTDWAEEPNPIAALTAKGMRRYSIDIPYVSDTLALAYDTVWPLIREDQETVDRVQALGVTAQSSQDVVNLIEEMLAAKLQCALDRGARSNLPRESMGALSLIRSLDRPDAQEAMDWLYQQGPDHLSVFCTNDFLPDGSPPEATGGYNGIHTVGLFALEYHLRRLRQQHPHAYPESRYPSLLADPRAVRAARQPHELTMIGKAWFQYGDGSSPGSLALHGRQTEMVSTLKLGESVTLPGLDLQTIVNAAEFTGDPIVSGIRDSALASQPRRIGTTIHDGVGIAILRTGETPERAALGIVYGDVINHRHMDLLDVQLFAFNRPFLTDLGYPQSWATRRKWEGNWATHNTVWTVIPGEDPNDLAGRGRLVRTLFAEGLQILDIEAERWGRDAESGGWRLVGGTFRRLIALVETDGDGVAVIDLSRIWGGAEHWRSCRGLQGSFTTEELVFSPRSGTVAAPDGLRGAIDTMPSSDYEGLACMDDVSTISAKPTWKGTWISSVEPDVCLDVFQVGVSDGTELINARATAMMGTPEESAYLFRALLWRRQASSTNDVSRIDLVMEPRVGLATLKTVRAVDVMRGDSTATGVSLTTHQGKQVTVYWAPNNDAGEETVFEDGFVFSGPLAAEIDGRVVTTGVSMISKGGHNLDLPGRQQGPILALSRKDRTIDTEGLSAVKQGDRIRINPEGRGHSYQVEAIEPLSNGLLRLTLDVTSVLGRGTLASQEGTTITVGVPLLTRTGNLNRTRLEIEENGSWTCISDAKNLSTGHTALRLTDGERFGTPAVGTWVSVVDYVVGDMVWFEPTMGGFKSEFKVQSSRFRGLYATENTFNESALIPSTFNIEP